MFKKLVTNVIVILIMLMQHVSISLNSVPLDHLLVSQYYARSDNIDKMWYSAECILSCTVDGKCMFLVLTIYTVYDIFI